MTVRTTTQLPSRVWDIVPGRLPGGLEHFVLVGMDSAGLSAPREDVLAAAVSELVQRHIADASTRGNATILDSERQCADTLAAMHTRYVRDLAMRRRAAEESLQKSQGDVLLELGVLQREQVCNPRAAIATPFVPGLCTGYAATYTAFGTTLPAKLGILLRMSRLQKATRPSGNAPATAHTTAHGTA